MIANAININNLRIRYYFPEQRDVINLSLDIQPNDFYFVTGPNGSGKSTLLKALAGLLETKYIESGTINFADSALQPHQFRSGASLASLGQVSFVDQHPKQLLNPDLSVLENLQIQDACRSPFGLLQDSKTLHQRIESIEEVPVDVRHALLKYSADSPLVLSGGYMQLLVFLRNALTPPDFLLLDEPLAHLDSRLTSVVKGVVSRIANSGLTTIFMVSHTVSGGAMSNLTNEWGLSSGRVQSINLDFNGSNSIQTIATSKAAVK
jgi:ABC-type multidrug transport system ATPase subunit